jgi:Flp pilus assembly protein CpaB
VQTVLQNIEVLAVGETAQEPLPASQGGTAEDGTVTPNAPAVATSGRIPDDVETNPDASTVTLAVDPAQAQLLVGVQQTSSSIWLSQRAASDQVPVDIGPSNLDSTGVH